ncbi:mannose-1-phosphate guanylyltransferase/mannose-6-phosphate isomerase [Bordetella petrii]|uniref:mannose-1-phosphate guanylyltransferase/mannose-6-phosphate isomerase n=1 Tax=Bordetella petrii TaxID=94624 RepID=UPI001E5F57E5|nr:mannose-1-phosphate guanylyltransferase/mannose-6-phosphate isomerase [Bordetella petrii]MCD0504884.1 mannose-1-phosphate guanylyltransferase/mannose-6-phosphate isomerase [Bordetella petrii]
MSFVPIILCGGAGRRLWPVSRQLHPKPFIRLADGQSLLQKAFLRAGSLPDVAEIVSVTNRDLFFKTEDEYRETGLDVKRGFILEPEGRNTAPALAAAALSAKARHGEQAVLLVLSADHLISDSQAFAAAVAQAVELARQGKVVTFGIKPDSPETGYGYIEADGTDVLRFVEKPDLQTATEYVNSGRYSWNAGIFCLTVATALQELRTHAPQISHHVAAALDKGRTIGNDSEFQIELDAEAFHQAEAISIDYAIMEKTRRAAVITCDIGWSDIGSWSALGDLAQADAQGNSVEGQVVLHDVTNCYIRSEARLVGAIGLDNLIIIDTPDALLVSDKNRTQDVKTLVGQLRAKSHESYMLHRTVHRPWGTYTVLEEGPNFKIKRVVVKPGASLSLQMHQHRSEHWVVVDGLARVINGDKEMLVASNESTFIPAGHKHRLENPGETDLVLIEVQSGAHLSESDIVRFQDIYGRC